MSMQRDAGRPRSGGAALTSRLAMSVALSLAAAACGSVNPGAITGSLAPSATAADARIAFESIDGVPPDVFHRLVGDLTEEAAARQIAVVPAGAGAPYRIRGYLAAHAEHGATTVVWAWDVYDADLQRAFRLDGEEHTGAAARKDAPGKRGGDQWAAADEALLRRIARAGMDQMARFIAAGPPPPEPAAAPPPRNGEPVASRGTTTLADAAPAR
jgi:hypothetical protein